MYVWPTCPSEISNIILTLKNKLSALDLVPTKVIKASPDNILVALSHVFDLSLSKGKFINDFEIAKVSLRREMQKISTTTDQSAYCPMYQKS